jgi:hypothetical protein
MVVDVGRLVCEDRVATNLALFENGPVKYPVSLLAYLPKFPVLIDGNTPRKYRPEDDMVYVLVNATLE